MKSGIRIVAMRNALVRMRSRYSRLAMSQMLCIDFLSGLDGSVALGYFFDEDLFEGRLHHFEAGDAGGRDCCGEESLGISSIVEANLGMATVVLCGMDGGMVEK